MFKNNFYGSLVHLAAIDPEEIGAMLARHSSDTEFSRLEDTSPCIPLTKDVVKKWNEKMLENPNIIAFAIRTLAEDRLIGDVGMGGMSWNHGDAFIGIGIGDREFWGKGYGSDAMKLALDYAFDELNLRRVSLSVFEYNPRAIRCYEKLGFQHEGRVRQSINREGRRWDLVYMGILKEEWLALRAGRMNL